MNRLRTRWVGHVPTHQNRKKGVAAIIAAVRLGGSDARAGQDRQGDGGGQKRLHKLSPIELRDIMK